GGARYFGMIRGPLGTWRIRSRARLNCGEQQVGVGRHPRRDRDRLIGGFVERDLEGVAAGVLNVVAVALGHVADVAGSKLIGACAAVRAEHRHAPAVLEIELSLRCVWMPMRLAQRARLDDEDGASDGGRDWEL